MQRAAYLCLSLLASTFLTFSTGSACTIFRSPLADDTRVAHNLDWYSQFPDTRGMFILNPANLQKTGLVFGAQLPLAHWRSVWNSVTFSIGGAELPVSGFNEKGLFMAILVLPDAKYPAESDPRPALGVSQFVQYNLDVSETLEQVIASDKVLRPFASFKMHYFVCDASAKCAVLQYLNGQLQVYRDQDLPYDVLTNSLYTKSVEAARNCSEQACAQPDTSLWRFGQAVLKRGEWKAREFTIENAFVILNHVAQTTGITTRFQLFYDPAHARLSVRRSGQSTYASVQVDLHRLPCNVIRKVIPLEASSAGELSGAWQDLTESMQYDMAIKMGLPPAMAAVTGRFPFESTACQAPLSDAPHQAGVLTHNSH